MSWLFYLGVDSMVIAKILVYLRNSGRLPLGPIVAIHIDYANREESAMEADFIRFESIVQKSIDFWKI